MYKRTLIFCFLIVLFIFFATSFHFDNNTLFEIDDSVQLISHNCNGSDTINVTIQNTITSVKLLWRKNSNPWDSVNMINTVGFNWRGIFYTSGTGAYNYYIKFLDS